MIIINATVQDNEYTCSGIALLTYVLWYCGSKTSD